VPYSRAEVVEAVRTAFPRADLDAILAILDEYGVESYQRERDRVHLAVVNLSQGDPVKLRYFVDVAKQDYRDVLFWSDCPDEAKFDTPEKKRSLREMLAKLGLKPPSDLDDA